MPTPIDFETAGDDTLSGTATRIVIDLRDGNDHCDAGKGADLVIGGFGDETLGGWNAVDVLLGGKGVVA